MTIFIHYLTKLDLNIIQNLISEARTHSFLMYKKAKDIQWNIL